jgi:Fe-S-cluster containining protein
MFDYGAFEGEVARRAAETLAGARTTADMASSMGPLTALAECQLARLLAAGEKARIACRPGCAACCTVNVAVLLPEAAAIAHYLLEKLAGEGFAACKGKLDRLAERIRWVDDEERSRRGIPCAFLDERGWCIIHPVRPFLCRALTSADPEQCRQALSSWVFGEEELILMNLSQKFLMDTAFKGVASALDRLGLDSRSYELTSAVRGLLGRPELLGEFVGGKRVSLD